MFGKLNNNAEKQLYKQYRKLMNEAYRLSRSDRKLSDQKYAEADEIMRRILELKRNYAAG